MLPQGDELRYLRALSLVDSAPALDITLQPAGQAAQAAARLHAATGLHPWQARFASDNARANALPFGGQWQRLRPEARAIFLSDRPLDLDDGVAWSGRGSTLVLQGGVAAQWWQGRLRAQLAPVAFVAQNASFALAPNGFSDARQYRDARFPNNIDLPQRFGDAAYARLDLGDSFVEATLGPLQLSASTARQHWGPAQEYPLVLGGGSGGFPHLAIGSAAPVHIYVGDVQLRVIAARLSQSEYSPVVSGEQSRFLSGAIVTFRPRFAPAAELGFTRLVNGPWPAEGFGLRQWLLPFEGLINDNTDPINQNANNGFAGVFLRLAPAGSGLEAYAELSREDFAGDLRQLILEPDDLVHYTLGVTRARRVGTALHLLRVELVNGEVSHFEREGRTLRRPIPPYTHGRTRQGLTNRGQLLGSAAAYGGAGATLAWERYRAAGRDRLSVDRRLLRDWLPALGPTGGVPEGEVTYRLRGERLRFRGDGEWGVTAGLLYTMNRNLVAGRDVLGLELQLRARLW